MPVWRSDVDNAGPYVVRGLDIPDRSFDSGEPDFFAANTIHARP